MLLTACSLRAAVIRGTVVEHQTGKFLARATVVVQPIAGTPGASVSMRTNISGLFEFSSLAPGSYVVKVSRPGFMPVEYGQKRWNSAGMPLVLDDSTPAFLAIRLPRWAAVSGTVVDENDIGLPEHDVLAYRATRPPQLVAQIKSDERGVYRVSGLEPGTYLIRTAGAQYEEGAYLPTFGKESIPVENARLVDVDLDQQANNIDVRPFLGRLFTVSGEVIPDIPQDPEPPPVPIKVTLATDMGRQSVVTISTGPPAPFRFAALVPGAFEIYAEAPVPPDPSIKLQGVYISSTLHDDMKRVSLALSSRSNVTFDIRGGPARGLENGQVQLQARRKDLAGEGEIVAVKFVNGRAQLAPGRWEVRLLPPAGYYVSSFSGGGSYRAARTPPRWLERDSRQQLRRVRPLHPCGRRRLTFGSREGRQQPRSRRTSLPGSLGSRHPPAPGGTAHDAHRRARRLPFPRPRPRRLPRAGHLRIQQSQCRRHGPCQCTIPKHRGPQRPAARRGSVHHSVIPTLAQRRKWCRANEGK